MSDNGGISNPGTRSGKPFMQNYPLRAGKGSVYEGGIREPMIVKWPAVVKPSTVAKQPVIIEDFFPTILEIAKLKNYKTVQVIDGRSLLPILKSPSYADSSRVLIWHSPNKWINNDGPGINFYSAIRQGNWKLVYSMRTGKMELYNVANDIGETVDLYSLYPEKVKQLSALLANRLTTWESPMPKDKQTGKPVSIPLSK
jgi:arylsulfatase A-like enzyme